MDNILEEFRHRRSFVSNMNYKEVSSRLTGFLNWLDSNEATAAIMSEMKNDTKVEKMLEHSDFHTPPSASNPEDFALIGLHFIREVASGKDLYWFSHKYGIHPSYQTNSIQALADEVVQRYIEPAFDYIAMKLTEFTKKNKIPKSFAESASDLMIYPDEIVNSLQKFQRDHLSSHKTAFIMMQFGMTKAHEEIVNSIKSAFLKHGIIAMRADDKEYHDNLLRNVLTYVYGCDIGVAVFERIEADSFNPNVSFEVGYMRALNKPICLLKDKTIKTLQTDLLGELYKSFDSQDPESSIPVELEKWLRDKGIISLD